MSLTLFDLDNTLIAGDSDHAWGEFLIANKLVDADDFKRANDQFYEDYCEGRLDIRAYLRFALTPLSRFDAATLSTLHAQFMRDFIEPIMLPKAHALIESHRKKGDTLLVITATNRFVTAPIVAAYGIEHLLASDGEIVDGQYTGEPAGVPCFAEGKVVRLQQWLSEHDVSIEGAHFYSDSHNDVPLLEFVDHPVVVDPDPTLADIAQSKGWPCISLRGE